MLPNHFETALATTTGLVTERSRRRYRNQQTSAPARIQPASPATTSGVERRAIGTARPPRPRVGLVEHPPGELLADRRLEQGELVRRSRFLHEDGHGDVRHDQEQHDGDRGNCTAGRQTRDAHRYSGVEERDSASRPPRSRGAAGHLPQRRAGAFDRVGREHEELRPHGHEQHDGEHRRPLRGEVAVAVERAGEVEVEHARAPVGAESLGRDERANSTSAIDDRAVVRAVRREDVLADEVDGEESCDADVDEGRERMR